MTTPLNLGDLAFTAECFPLKVTDPKDPKRDMREVQDLSLTQPTASSLKNSRRRRWCTVMRRLIIFQTGLKTIMAPHEPTPPVWFVFPKSPPKRQPKNS